MFIIHSGREKTGFHNYKFLYMAWQAPHLLGCHRMVVDEHHLEKEYIFSNFRQALAFTNQVGELAETEGHHPDICLA